MTFTNGVKSSTQSYYYMRDTYQFPIEAYSDLKDENM